MTELTERAVTERVPGLIDEKLKVISRRDPVTVRPGTSLQTCLELIRETGMADSVFVTDAGGRLLGVLTERDIFARLVGPDADLSQPVEKLMIDHPNTLHLDQPVRRAVELMQTGKFRNVPLVDDGDLLVGVVLLIELKTAEAIAPIHLAQVIAYLANSKQAVALLINFNVRVLKDGIKRIVRSR